jgi:epoxyqueuosine reductase QueG
MDERKTNYVKLKELAHGLGMSLFGVGEIESLRDTFFHLPPAAVEGLTAGISLGTRLSTTVLEGIVDQPTPLYFHHYRQANNLLDQGAFKLTQFIQGEGFRALPIAASQIVDWENQKGHLPHKKMAALAGLGWIGRNNLLVAPEYGAAVRLATILTDLPLPFDAPVSRGCGTCRDCIPVCPVGAIKESQADFDHLGCFEKLQSFRRLPGVGQYICGICVRACRGGRAST